MKRERERKDGGSERDMNEKDWNRVKRRQEEGIVVFLYGVMSLSSNPSSIQIKEIIKHISFEFLQ